MTDEDIESKAVVLQVQRQLYDTKKLVYNLLIGDERARNSDKWLEYKVFLYDTGLTVHALPFEVWESVRSMESVRRTRQLIVVEHPELDATDPEIIKRRDAAREGYRRFCGGKERI